jgi:hypothetical protein
VIGPDQIHLLLPTNDTPMLEAKEVSRHIAESTKKWTDDKTMAYGDLVKELALKFKLGFYSSSKTAQMTRVK